MNSNASNACATGKQRFRPPSQSENAVQVQRLPFMDSTTATHATLVSGLSAWRARAPTGRQTKTPVACVAGVADQGRDPNDRVPSAAVALALIRDAGVVLRMDGCRLLASPREKVTGDVAALIAAHRAGLAGLLQAPPSPADAAPTTARARRPRPAPGSVEPSELQIHMSVAAHLRARAKPGTWWAHYPAGELRDERTAHKLKQMGTKPGVPDMLLLVGGKLHGLELKRDGGRLSPEQRACHAEIEAAGGFVATAWCVDTALAILTAWGVLRPDAGQTERTASNG